MITPETASFLWNRIRAARGMNDPGQELREIRMTLESLFNMLTGGEERTFSNLYAKTRFVFDKGEIPEDIQTATNALRRFSNRALTGKEWQETELPFARKAIVDIVAYFSGGNFPSDLREEADLDEERTWLAQGEADAYEETRSVKAVVRAVHENGWDCSSEDAGNFFLQWNEESGKEGRNILDWVEPYDVVRIIAPVRMDDSGRNFSVGPGTQIVLEPDLLLDISDLAECFTSSGVFPLSFLVKKLVPQTPGEAAFRGNIVNAVFDAAIRREVPSFKEIFRDSVADQAFQAGAYGRECLNTMFRDVQRLHWSNLRQVAGSLKQQPARIEPAFISAEFGLQGRLDVMLENSEDQHRKEIIELKSGKPPERDTWMNHGMQVVGYNMLLKSTFGEKRRGASAILYSAAPNAPLRNVTSNLFLENRLLKTRNQAVTMLLQLARGRFGFLEEILPEKTLGLPAFTRKDYECFHRAYSMAGKEEKAYYETYLSFLIREYLQSKSGLYGAWEREDAGPGFSALWQLTEEEKLRLFSIIRKLRFLHISETDHHVRFDIGEAQHHNFRVGDTIVLYPRANGKLEPGLRQIVKGRIDQLGPEALVLSLNNHQLDASYFSGHEEWVVEHDVYESNFWLTTRALLQVLLPENKPRFDLLLGKRAPEMERITHVPEPGLNANQQQILDMAVAAGEYFLLQGPPGTGKTSTLLTRMVKRFFAEKRTTVVVAFTNRAVEEISSRLKKQGIPFMRLGSMKSESEQQLRNACKTGDIAEAIARVKEHRVFLATVATMVSRLDGWKMYGHEADTLIVDEASQLTEPQLLPLVMAFRKCILVGDQNQLPPVVAQDARFCKTDNALLREAGISDLRESLFERLMKIARRKNWRHAFGMLNTHFRMHEKVAALINHYYDHQLVCGQDLQKQERWQLPGTGRFTSLLEAGRAVFIPSSSGPYSRYHTEEAQRVAALLNELKERYGKDFSTETVGVVTPWRTQIGLIRSLMAPEDVAIVNIDTVERFQGGENDIIIVSMAVSHAAQLNMLHSPGWFETEKNSGPPIPVDRKLLVTLSRARQQVIFLGNEVILNQSPHYRAVLQKMNKQEWR